MGIFSFLKRKEMNDTSSLNNQLKEETKKMEEKTISDIEKQERLSKPFLMRVEDVFTITGRGTIAVGKIETGRISMNELVIIERTGKPTKIIGIEMFRKMLDYAEAGDNVGILLENINRDEIISGDIIKK